MEAVLRAKHFVCLVLHCQLSDLNSKRK